MDLISPPDYLEEPVRDLDITYVSGQVHTITMKETHTFRETTAHLVIEIPENKERVVVERKNVLYFSVRARMHRTPKPKPAHAPSGYATMLEVESHVPWCSSRKGVGFDPGRCNCKPIPMQGASRGQ